MDKLPYIVTAIVFVLAAIFALVVKFWAGFVYFVLALLLLLALFWFAWYIYRYFTVLKYDLQEQYKFFKAEKINRTQISVEEYNNNEVAYKKEFSKKSLKDKLRYVAMMLFCLAIAAAMLIAMICY